MRILPVLLCAPVLFGITILAGCGSSDDGSKYLDSSSTTIAGTSGRLTLGVNTYLWHATLDTLSMMPVVSAAPFGGVTIALAWLRTPLWLFLGATWLGGTTSLIFETSVGAGLGEVLAHNQHVGLNLFLHPQVLRPMGALAVLALGPLAIQRLQRRKPPQA
mgnify:CR=1 FL=1